MTPMPRSTLRFTKLHQSRGNQDLRADPELDDVGYSLKTVATVTNFDEINKFQFPAARELPED